MKTKNINLSMIEDIKFNNILVPFDGSSGSFYAFKYAIKLATFIKDCMISIINIIDEDKVKHISNYQNVNFEQLKRKFIEQGNKYCNRAILDAKRNGFDDSNIEVNISFGNPVQEIIKFSSNFDIIIIASRSTRRISDYTIGHITDQIIHLSSIPVLVLP